MGKLFKLKRWLTLQEAANHLTQLFGETVSDIDILRLASDHRLKLSVVFVGDVLAYLCKPVDDCDLTYQEVPTLDMKSVLKVPVGGQVVYRADGQTLQVQKKEPFWLDSGEPYDLSMIGGEVANVEYQYWQLAGGPQVETTNIYGTFVSSGRDTYQLVGKLSPKKVGGEVAYYPLGALPKDSALVVTPGSLMKLEKSLSESDEKEEKSLSTKERETLLKLVIGMAVKGYRHDPTASKSSAPKEISDDLVDLGISVSDDTVRKYLKQAADTVLPGKARPS